MLHETRGFTWTQAVQAKGRARYDNFAAVLGRRLSQATEVKAGDPGRHNASE